MGRVWWSAQAEADLESIDPAVRDQLRRNAEMILHDILPRTTPLTKAPMARSCGIGETATAGSRSDPMDPRTTFSSIGGATPSLDLRTPTMRSWPSAAFIRWPTHGCR